MAVLVYGSSMAVEGEEGRVRGLQWLINQKRDGGLNREDFGQDKASLMLAIHWS